MWPPRCPTTTGFSGAASSKSKRFIGLPSSSFVSSYLKARTHWPLGVFLARSAMARGVCRGVRSAGHFLSGQGQIRTAYTALWRATLELWWLAS